MSPPYLSAVATSRNDDHGRNLLGRMQAFVSGFVEQCARHRLDAELIIVEWNPPAERPPLAEALRWPASGCKVRLVHVSPELHRRLRHSDALPLFQMIAKNVGIRRAAGEFVLATNVDVLFSDELMQLMASRALDPARMYRVDRYDVMDTVPVDAPMEEKLAFCRSHLLRRNVREASIPLEPDGTPALQAPDVAAPGDGIRFGRGFYACYDEEGTPQRWANREAEILVQRRGGDVLAIDLEPGPRLPVPPFTYRITDERGAALASGSLGLRATVLVELPPPTGRPEVYRIQSDSRDPYCAGNAQVLSARLYRCWWPGAVERARIVANAALAAGARTIDRRRAAPYNVHVKPIGPEVPVHLHTNGCGDFTLLSREKWFDLRGYPEFECFSFHLDSVFCYAAHHGGAEELVLPDPMRVYHIEHETGSGWTPEGHDQLFRRLEQKRIPALDGQTVFDWGVKMRQLRTPMVFNLADWGWEGVELPETVVVAG